MRSALRHKLTTLLKGDAARFGGSVGPRGTLHLQVIRSDDNNLPPTNSLLSLWRRSLPELHLPWFINRWRLSNQHRIIPELLKLFVAKVFHIRTFYGALYLKVIRADGRVEMLGLAGLRSFTTAGATDFVDNLRTTASDIASFKFHALGTGSTAENVADTALVTELTTQYNPDSTRATGSQTNNGATVYRTVGTNTVDATAAVQEHGILTQAATGGGKLLDRTVFTTVNLASGDSLQSTYDLTINTGG